MKQTSDIDAINSNPKRTKRNQLIFPMVKEAKTLTDFDEVLSCMHTGEWIITEVWKSDSVYYHLVKII